jgi:hypothetical protein
MKINNLRMSANTTNLSYDLRLIEIKDFDFSRLRFSEPQDRKNPAGSFKSVRMTYQYDEKTYGPPIVPLRKKLCWGVQPNNVDKDGNQIVENGVPVDLSGYKAPILMTSKEPQKEELEEVEFFDALHATIQDWAVKNKGEYLKKKKSDETIMDMVSPLLYRKDDESSPRLYAELIYYKDKKKMDTKFYGPGDKLISPQECGRSFLIEPNIKFDTINITSKAIKLKVRIYDATIEPLNRGGMQKRLARKNEVNVDEQEYENDNTETVEEVEEVEDKDSTGFESD